MERINGLPTRPHALFELDSQRLVVALTDSSAGAVSISLRISRKRRCLFHTGQGQARTTGLGRPLRACSCFNTRPIVGTLTSIPVFSAITRVSNSAVQVV